MPELIYEKKDVFAVFTLNRPERLNALGVGLNQELEAAVEDFNADPQMRVGILTGAGRAFSAGMDLKEAAERAARGESVTTPRSRAQALSGAGLFSLSPKPFIAAINGLALGAGMERALDCDIRICSTEAYFGQPEPKRGILAGYAIHHLPRVLGMSAANYILLTGAHITAEQALAWGIVTEA